MVSRIVLSVILLVQIASAHFQIDYPYWRDNSFSAPYSQYIYPCAGINQSTSANNRTLWPLTGGSLTLELHHPWTYVFINLGLGSNVTTNFNISLTPQFLNETGNGTLCLPQVKLPSGLVTDGQNATLQIVTSGTSGSALYNCADITFSSKATLLSADKCQNTTGLTAVVVAQQGSGSSTTNSSASNTTSSSASASTSAKSAASERFGMSGLWLIYVSAGVMSLNFVL